MKTKSLKSYKTPLRYPGGKSRALSKLFQFIPDLKDYTEFREPFLGGGSVAIEIGKRYPHLEIWVNVSMNHCIIFGRYCNQMVINLKTN